MCQEISSECQKLCKYSGDSVLQNVSATDLQSFTFSELLVQWKAESPLFLNTLSAVISQSLNIPERHVSNVAFAGSILLRCRNPRMSAAAYIVGLLLDYGGAHDETVRKLCSIGASVSPDSVRSKKKEISQLHDKHIKERFTDYKKTLTDIKMAEDTLKLLTVQTEITSEPTTSTAEAVPMDFQTQSFRQTHINMPIVMHMDPIYANPLMKKMTTKASLVTSVSDISEICKNTETVNKQIAANSDRTELLYHTNAQPNMLSNTTDGVCYGEAKTDNTTEYLRQFVKRSKEKVQHERTTEIYGDNCDLRVNVSHQTKEKRHKDYHWFLTLAADLRVKGENLATVRPRREIQSVQNSEFLPSTEDNSAMMNCFVHHIMKVLVTNIESFNIFKDVIPAYLNHPYMKEYKTRSTYTLIDLHDKNESKNEDMIDILSELQEKCIPYLPDDVHMPAGQKNVIERKVFGGDVLTNERAYQAQLDMYNGQTESEKLMGFIHRPEGLHRLMNLLKYIYETFYLTSSVNEQGTMYQLKCLLDRRDVKVDMTAAYRQCKNFLDDVLDGHILSAACHFFGMTSLNAKPTQNKMPLFLEHATKEDKLDWVSDICKSILDIYVLEESRAVPDIFEDTQYMETQLQSLSDSETEKKFKCPHLDCGKTYKQFHWLRRHMKDKHATAININPPQHSSTSSSDYDGVFNVASAFMKVGLLFRDTEDAYKMGDGNRILQNAKFELLHFHQGHHIKYRLWLWRMLAYEKALLSEKEAFEYKWNMSFNYGRGLGHLIPNDNLVEMNVHLLKEQARRMGANVTFDSCRSWVKCLKYLSELSDSFDKMASVPKRSGKHAEAKRKSELLHILTELNEKNVFHFTPGREHASFVNFSSDLLTSVNSVELSEWMNKQKKRAQKEMQTM